MKKPRILLADDHVLVAEALGGMLAGVYDIVGTVNDGRSLLDTAMTLKPDLVVVDIGMPQLNGLDATRQLKRLLPNVKVIILTMNEESSLVVEAFQAGATGYLLKHSAPKELLQAIEEVLKGASYLSPRITSGAVAAMLRSGVAKPQTGLRTHSASTRSNPTFGRRSIDEGDRGRSYNQPPNGGCSQVPRDGAAGD
jgi:DNA-binding NarL/FixJ family response regulator